MSTCAHEIWHDIDVGFFLYVIFTFIYIHRPGRTVSQSGHNVSWTEEIGFLKIRNIRCLLDFGVLGPPGSRGAFRATPQCHEPCPVRTNALSICKSPSDPGCLGAHTESASCSRQRVSTTVSVWTAMLSRLPPTRTAAAH